MLSTNTQLAVQVMGPTPPHCRAATEPRQLWQWSLQDLEEQPGGANAIPGIATLLWPELAGRHPPEGLPRDGAAGPEPRARNSGSQSRRVGTVAVAVGLGNHGDEHVFRFLERKGNGPTCFRRSGS